MVVAAVVINERGVLLARRRYGSLAGYWEFPGGKVEPGETHHVALARELREELNVDAIVGDCLGETEHLGSRGVIRIAFYLCDLRGEPVKGPAHDALVWSPWSDVLTYKLAPADIPIIQKLLERNDAT